MVPISIATMPVAGTNYTTFTTAKSMLGSATATGASSAIVPINGRTIIVGTKLTIKFQTSVSWASGNTMTISVMMGTTAVFTSDALKVTTTGGTLITATGTIELTCQSAGNGTLATFMGGGELVGRMIVPPGATAGADYTAGSGSSTLKATSAVGTGFDSTISNALDFQVAMGASSASNGWRMEQYEAILSGVYGP